MQHDFRAALVNGVSNSSQSYGTHLAGHRQPQKVIWASKLIFFSIRLESGRYDLHSARCKNLFRHAFGMTASRFPGIPKVFDWPEYFCDSKTPRDFRYYFRHTRMRMRMFVRVHMAGNDARILNFLNLGS